MAIAERSALVRAGVMHEAVRFEYALNFDAMFPTSTPSLWPQKPPAQC